MAVALATLPLKRLVTDAADAFCGACTGTAATLAAAFVGAAFDAGVLATGALVATFAGGLTTVFTAAGFAGAALTATLLGGAFLAETGVVAAFFAGALFTGTFFAAAFWAMAFVAGLMFFGGAFATAFFAFAFGALTLTADFFKTAFLAETGLAAAFFAVAVGTDLVAACLAFTGVLVVAFTSIPFLTAGFDELRTMSCAFVETFPFWEFVLLEPRVVFAMSLHRFGCDGRVL